MLKFKIKFIIRARKNVCIAHKFKAPKALHTFLSHVYTYLYPDNTEMKYKLNAIQKPKKKLN